MGTDIHSIFQARNESGEWVDIESNYDGRRHYQLFAVLAGVRNGHGFAGVRTGDPVVPISQPRGLPSDVINHENGCPRFGDHSYSWLSGAEMLAWFESAPTVRVFGVLSREAYEAWDGHSEPPSWWGSVTGPDILTVDEGDVRIPRPWKFANAWTHVRVTWRRDLRVSLAYFFDEVQRLVDLHGEIRFVFGFDS